MILEVDEVEDANAAAPSPAPDVPLLDDEDVVYFNSFFSFSL